MFSTIFWQPSSSLALPSMASFISSSMSLAALSRPAWPLASAVMMVIMPESSLYITGLPAFMNAMCALHMSQSSGLAASALAGSAFAGAALAGSAFLAGSAANAVTENDNATRIITIERIKTLSLRVECQKPLQRPAF